MPTGWRPEDVAEKHPVHKISDVYAFDKYDTEANGSFAAWIWIQMTTVLLMVSYLFGNIAPIGSPAMFIYGAFIFVFIYAMTELMDRNRYAWIWEIIKICLGAGILIYYGDWFGMSKHFAGANVVFIIYFLVSMSGTLYFAFEEKKKNIKP